MHECLCVECGVKFEAKTMFATVCSPKCSMRRYRKTEKGKAQVLRFNKNVKRPAIDKVCVGCNDPFVTARVNQALCRECSPVVGAYNAQKKYRERNLEKIRRIGKANKQAQRRYYFSECCVIEGCLNEGHRHHPDYEKPNEIVWLCRQHHRDAHTGKGRSVFTKKEIRSDLKDCHYYQGLFKDEEVPPEELMSGIIGKVGSNGRS